ncbi:hypothetical protein FHR90_002421 [Endobacter medicaginis]|uniref:Uncharacterized protein n=1 Tax=Endobacter medicaginis TaxID=1181271 RepID=A0A839UXT7_9PROT|nr:hypothetical protein [Endobacter medicaginis]MBB3174576.1 hypothetical protein [Endobacter medicaginis]MCX5474732.1 hypothetical protein [Endobacter medicaginis]NVN32254.1 hypothetical protein [Endobacter medicaginis]
MLGRLILAGAMGALAMPMATIPAARAQADRLDAQALADDAGQQLAIHSYPGGGTVETIETCYASARRPDEMRKCIALDEVSDLANWYINIKRGDRSHSAFWSDAALAGRMTPARVTFAFGSEQVADDWTTRYLLLAYDRAVHSPAAFGPLHGHIFTRAPAM